MKIICRRFQIKTPFTFWDKRTWDIWKVCLQTFINIHYPVDTWLKLNVHKTFRRCPGRLLNVLCAFNLCPVFTGTSLQYLASKEFPLGVWCYSANNCPNIKYRNFWSFMHSNQNILKIMTSKLEKIGRSTPKNGGGGGDARKKIYAPEVVKTFLSSLWLHLKCELNSCLN